MNLQVAQTLAISLMEKHGLIGWYFEFDNAKGRFGVCNYRYNKIGLSRHLTELNGIEEVRDTILHEIAHALVGFSHGHDWVWKQKALEIGCNGDRCYNEAVVTPDAKYTATCPNTKCGHTYKKYKMSSRNKRGSCSKCGNGRFNPDLELKWVKNY